MSCQSSSLVLGVYVGYLNPCWWSAVSDSTDSIGPILVKPCFHSLNVAWVQEEGEEYFVFRGNLFLLKKNKIKKGQSY